MSARDDAETKAAAPAIVQSDEVKLTTDAQVQELLRCPRPLRFLRIRVFLTGSELARLCLSCRVLALDEDGMS
jgi:hypothetical protein